ncbi:MAG: hypothetical protein JXC31_03390 [Acholeplasmataceae bacterium]|nr:hypothetical protein [Acholeplasmataceae bacterium]
MNSINQNQLVFHNSIAVGKAVVFNIEKEIFLIQNKEIEKIFNELNLIKIHEYNHFRDIKMALSNHDTKIYDALSFIFFIFDTLSINLRFRNLVIDEKVNYLLAFEKSLDEFLISDLFVIPHCFIDEAKLIETYIQELKKRLIFRFEMSVFQKFRKEIKCDYILVADEFKKEYFDEIELNCKGVICKNANNLDLVKLFAHEYELPIAIYNQNIIDGTIVTIDGVLKRICTDSVNDSAELQINSSQEEISNNDEGYDYPYSKIKIYAPLVDMRYIKYVAQSKWYTGIAPFKSEYMFVTSGLVLSFEQQYKRYERMMKDIGDKEIYIGIPDFRPERPTEFLGKIYTDIDTYDTFDVLFDNQLKAIAMASLKYNRQINIVVPMIRIPEEVDYWKENIKSIFEYYMVYNVKVGIMIETESAFEFFEEYRGMDFAIIGLNDLIEELSDDFDRYSKLTKDEMLDIFWPNLRELHQFFRTFKMQTKHIIAGNFLSNPDILLKLINSGFSNFSIQPSQFKFIEKTLMFHDMTRGSFKGISAQRESMKDLYAAKKIETIKRKELEQLNKIEYKEKKKKAKEQRIRDMHKAKREIVIRKLLDDRDNSIKLKKIEKK